MDKEKAISDFIEMIKHSWTYEKLTNEEKRNFENSVMWAINNKCINGSYNNRWKILHSLYHTFLNAIGYTSEKWREQE